MLPQLNKLTGHKNFQKVEAEGKVFQSEHFGVAYIKRDDKNPTRFGFVISNKVSKDATERNRVKRILREAVRQSLYIAKMEFDVVILAKQSIMRIPTDIIIKDVKRALKEAGLTE